MMFFWVAFTSRAEKRALLFDIIRNFSISPEEKDLYVFSMDVLTDEDFDRFFEKITSEFSTQKHPDFSFSSLT